MGYVFVFAMTYYLHVLRVQNLLSTSPTLSMVHKFCRFATILVL